MRTATPEHPRGLAPPVVACSSSEANVFQMVRRVAVVTAVILISSSGVAGAVEGIFSAGVYGPGTDMAAQPQPSSVFTRPVGEVGIQMFSTPLMGFKFTGAIETLLQPPEVGRFSLNASSVRYRFGFVRPMGPNVNLAFEHGSWHALDTTGFIPKYNKLGLEFTFSTAAK
jgi:hypothetical protein